MINNLEININQNFASRAIKQSNALRIEKESAFSYNILQDWKANKGNIKGRLVMIAFRIAHLATSNKISHILLVPYLVFYKVFVLWFLGIELQHRVKIGSGLKLSHGMGLVIHKSTIIGKNCTLRQCTTIGKKSSIGDKKSAGTIIGDHVDVGANVCIIGSIVIGNNTIIGAGSVVVKDVPENVVVVGNPARIIKSV